MKSTIVIELEIEGEHPAAASAVEAALDSGVLQDAINAHEFGGAKVEVMSAVMTSAQENEAPGFYCPADVDVLARCPGGCPGWGWFNGTAIQRCDGCRRFREDDEASAHIQGCEACSKELARIVAAEDAEMGGVTP